MSLYIGHCYIKHTGKSIIFRKNFIYIYIYIYIYNFFFHVKTIHHRVSLNRSILPTSSFVWQQWQKRQHNNKFWSSKITASLQSQKSLSPAIGGPLSDHRENVENSSVNCLWIFVHIANVDTFRWKLLISICKFLLLIQRGKKVNIPKWMNPRRDLYLF